MLSAVLGIWQVSVNKTKDFGSEELNLKLVNQKSPWDSVSQVEENFSFVFRREANVTFCPQLRSS